MRIFVPAVLILLAGSLSIAGQFHDNGTVAENAGNLVDFLGGGGVAKAVLVDHAVQTYEMREAVVNQGRELIPARVQGLPGKGDELLAGASSRVITPPRGCPLSGYGDRLKNIPFSYKPLKDPFAYSKLYKPSSGTHDDLTAKALVIDNGEKRVVLVAVDAIGMTQFIYESVLARVADLGITRENLILSGSHSHSGNGDAADTFFWNLVTVDLFDHRIFDPMVEKVVYAIEDAVTDLEPCRVGVGTGTDYLGISKNRRDDPVLDSEIGLIRVDTVDGDPKAVLFNFAIHGTVLGGDNLWFSGDNMGYAERYVEAELPGVIAMFTNGAEGDVAPTGGTGSDDWEEAESIGEKLGSMVLDIRSGITTETSLELDGVHKFIDLPVPFFRPAMFAEDMEFLYWFAIYLSGLVEQDNTNFTGIRIGSAVFVTMPGEPITQVGLDVKDYAEALGFDDAFVVGLANGHIGYITTAEEYWQGGYESGATLHGEGTGEVITSACTDLIYMLANRD